MILGDVAKFGEKWYFKGIKMKCMILSLNNIASYLVDECVLKKVGVNVVRISNISEIIEHGNSNYIFRVEMQVNHGKKFIIVKQARGNGKRTKKSGKVFRIDQKRIIGEHNMIKLLVKLWGAKHVPEVYHFDERNYILVMEDVSIGKKLLIDEYAQGNVHKNLGGLFGQMFGRLHSSTWDIKREVSGSYAWRKQFMVYVDKHYCFGIRKYYPEFEIRKIIKDSNACKKSVVWGDPVIRNIFVNSKSFIAIDFEHAMSFDPAFDLGLFLSQPLLMMLKSEKLEMDSQYFIRIFLKKYIIELKSSKKVNDVEVMALVKRMIKWLSIYLLSRVDGVNGSYFSNNLRLENKIRKHALNFLKNDKSFFKIVDFAINI